MIVVAIILATIAVTGGVVVGKMAYISFSTGFNVHGWAFVAISLWFFSLVFQAFALLAS